jgi:hypothetical protein
VGLRGELERLGYTPLSAAGHVRLVGAPEPLDSQRERGIVGVDAGCGGRALNNRSGLIAASGRNIHPGRDSTRHAVRQTPPLRHGQRKPTNEVTGPSAHNTASVNSNNASIRAVKHR